jgi:hypothetical protein
VNDLRELNISGGIFTWSNNQSSPTLERLDRILMNKDWELLFTNVCGYKEPRELSDHNPLIVSSCLKVGGNKREFRFELFWIKHPDFLKKVSKIWNAPTRDVNNLDKVLFKLKKVKKLLKCWGYNLSGSRKKRKKEIQDSLAVLEELEERGSLSAAQCENKIRWKAELLQILEDEELDWFKRSHET